LDLTPAPFDLRVEMPGSPQFAAILAGVGARRAASATARAQAALCPLTIAADPLFAPTDGAFNGGVARALTGKGQ